MPLSAWRWRVPRLRRILCPPNRLVLDPWVTRHAGQLTGLVVNVGSGEDLRHFGRRTIHVDAHAPSVTVRADVSAGLPFQDRTLDGAICVEVLEHVLDDAAVLAEVARVLKPGARLIVTVPFMFRYHPDPADFRRYTPSGLRALLERHGFDVESAAGLGGKPLGLLLWIDSIHVVVRLPLRCGLLPFRMLFAASSRRDAGWSDYAANAVAVARRRA
jgi:SAM-dependent methyltransferase